MEKDIFDYDYIIVGSGFGGSVSALRLSEKGYKVLVVEKGKWFKSKDFPKTNWNIRKWLWIPFFRFFGIMKMSIFRHIVIISGTGVGGGSLVYANTLPIPKTKFFKNGSWANLLDWENELKPFYQKALKMLGAAKNPILFEADLALMELAEKTGIPEHFESPDVAVYFGEKGRTVNDPYFNGEGPSRTGCVYCGACMTGCRFNAKNTLDKNYLFLAQKNGAEILAENEVVNVRPLNSENGNKGYEVEIKNSTRLFKKTIKLKSNGVIFSGGVLGTIKLLLKLKTSSLPNLSNKLAEDIRTNNESIISVSTQNKEMNMSKGIAIGSILHTDENSHLEIVRYAEGSGFWKLLHLPLVSGKNILIRLFKMFLLILKSPIVYAKVYIFNSWSKSTAVLLFMQTVDSTIKFKRTIFGGMKSAMTKGEKPSSNIPEALALARTYAQIVNGKETAFALETLAGIPSTAHILGGAVMGKNSSEGVIDKDNKVFAYENMYVIDGSMISANPGVNPSLSITAIAERCMAQFENKSK